MDPFLTGLRFVAHCSVSDDDNLNDVDRRERFVKTITERRISHATAAAVGAREIINFHVKFHYLIIPRRAAQMSDGGTDLRGGMLGSVDEL